MASSVVSSSVKTIAIIYLIGHSSNTQSWVFHDPAGIYNPTGPNAPHSGEVHNFCGINWVVRRWRRTVGG